MQGDVRAGLAERIRRHRRREEGAIIEEDEAGNEATVRAIRTNLGINESSEPRGDIVVGRHTWKEYIRGLHEGWLGPSFLPPSPEPEAPATDAGGGRRISPRRLRRSRQPQSRPGSTTSRGEEERYKAPNSSTFNIDFRLLDDFDTSIIHPSHVRCLDPRSSASHSRIPQHAHQDIPILHSAVLGGGHCEGDSRYCARR